MKYALIGCGRVDKHHILAARDNGIEIVALCDIDYDKAVAFSVKHGLENVPVYKDYKDLLKNEEVEDALKRFRYQTRSSSSDFCERLCGEMAKTNPNDVGNVTEYVKKQARTYLKRVYDDLNDEKYIDLRELNLSELMARFRIKKGII